MTYTVVLPMPPNIANSRQHWRVKLRARHEYEALAAMALRDHQKPKRPLGRARIHATLYLRGRMDGDNLVARMKWPVDCLVHAGWIKDDGPDTLRWTMPEQAIDRANPRIEIRLSQGG